METKCRVQHLENGEVRIMCGPDPGLSVRASDEDHVAPWITRSATARPATSESARLIGPAWATRSITARIIGTK